MPTEKTEASCGPVAAQGERLARWLDDLFTRVAKNAVHHASLWLAAFTVIYLACTVVRSLTKPLWFDELLTFYISRVPDWKERVALGAADGCPPPFHGLTHEFLRLFGETSLVSRMPEIIGFWLMCVCLFLFVRRRCEAIYAFLAVLLSVSSLAYGYAYEARPYGLILGMAGLSLFCWQSIVEGRRRTLALVFLTLSVGIAVNVHYYGAQIAVPLFAGEACRTLERKKFDWGVLSAIALGLLPLVVLLPPALTAFRGTYASAASPAVIWGKPHAGSFMIFYHNLVEPMLSSLVVGLTATSLIYLLGGRQSHQTESSAAKFPLHELAASVGYLLVPAMMLFATGLTTHYFEDRYALTAVVGCIILFVYLCNVFSRERFVLPCLLIVSLFCTWVLQTVRSVEQVSARQSDLCMSSLMYPKGDAFPIVVADVTRFLQMAHYSEPEVASRLVSLTDIAHASRRPDLHGEMSLFVARRALPGTVADYGVFLSRNREFWLLYYNEPTFEWLPSQLREEGWNLEYWGQDYDRMLFRVRR